MLSAADLTQPLGDLSADLFPVLPGETYATPDEKLEALIGSWLTQGQAALAGTPAAESDDALASYVYGKAKRSIYTRLLSAPSSASVEGEGSHSFTAAQIEAWGKQADGHDAAWRAAAATVLPVFVARPTPSGSTPTRACW